MDEFDFLLLHKDVMVELTNTLRVIKVLYLHYFYIGAATPLLSSLSFHQHRTKDQNLMHCSQ